MIREEDVQLLLEVLKNNDYCKKYTTHNSQLSLLFYQSVGVDNCQLSDPYYRDFLDRGILFKENDLVYASIRVVPFRGNYFLVDSPYLASTGGADHYHSEKKGMYGYIGNDGFMLLNYIISEIKNKKFQKGLDIGTGSGLIGISLLPWVNSMVGVDIDEPAVNWSKLNSKINNADKYFSCVGNLYEPAKDSGPFDLIVSNPSFSILPPELIEKYQVQTHEVAKDYGLEQVFKIIDGFEEKLTTFGQAFICSLVPVIHGREYILDQIKEKYSHKLYSFKIHYSFVKHTPVEFEKYYQSCGIDRLDFVFISICNGKKFSIKKTRSKFYLASRFRIIFNIALKLKHWVMKNLH